MSGKTNFTVIPLSSFSKMNKASGHNERQKWSKKEAHIDSDRTFLNEYTVGGTNMDLIKDILENSTGKTFSENEIYNKGDHSIKSSLEKAKNDSLYYKDGTKIRKDAVMELECCSSYPGKLALSKIVDGKIVKLTNDEIKNLHVSNTIYENIKDGAYDDYAKFISGKNSKGEPFLNTTELNVFWYPDNKEEFEVWKEATTEYTKEKFGENNVKQIVFHMDELTPHMHALVTPIKENGRFDRNHFYDGKNGLGKMQTEYFDKIKSKYKENDIDFNYERGRAYSSISHKSIKKMKYLSTRNIDKELPNNPIAANESYQAALVQNNILLEENKSLKKANERQALLLESQEVENRKREEISKENEKIKEQNQELNRKNILMTSCITGLNVMAKSSPEEIKQIKNILRDSVEIGYESLRDMSLVKNSHINIDDILETMNELNELDVLNER